MTELDPGQFGPDEKRITVAGLLAVLGINQ
jgi:hypothetical protein